jgi:hypothetical protein
MFEQNWLKTVIFHSPILLERIAEICTAGMDNKIAFRLTHTRVATLPIE